MFNVEGFYAGFYWGPRRESPHECAVRLGEWLVHLADLDPAFKDWQLVGRKRRQINTSLSELEKIIRNGWMRTDIGRELMDDGGAGVMLSNHPACRDVARLTIRCGAYSKWLSNSCLLEVPSSGKAATRFLNVPALTRLSQACVECWHPDKGVITSSRLCEAIDPGSDENGIGWIIYRSASTTPRGLKVPPPSYVRELNGLGYMIIAMDERPDPAHPSHLAILKSLHQCLLEQKSE